MQGNSHEHEIAMNSTVDLHYQESIMRRLNIPILYDEIYGPFYLIIYKIYSLYLSIHAEY